MGINLQKVTEITQDACSLFKSKALGGVSKESAQNAVSKAVKQTVQLAEEAMGKVQQEMQALKGKTAQEIAEITSKKDAFILQTKQEAAQTIADVQKSAAEAVKKARAPKAAERVLPNGHKEIRKVNKNGAVMVKEFNTSGQLIKSNVTTLDGSIRRTSYNPISGKPVKTFTNTSGKDMLIEYPDGGLTKMTRVNNKKVKPQKPTLVEQTRPEYVKSERSGEDGQAFERIYSNGSKEKIKNFVDTSTNAPRRTVIERYDKDGKLTSNLTHWAEGNCTREHFYSDSKLIGKEQYTLDGVKYKKYMERVLDKNTNDFVAVKAENSIGDKKTTYRAIKDEYGFYNGRYKATTTYPKESGKPASVTEVGIKDLPVIY